MTRLEFIRVVFVLVLHDSFVGVEGAGVYPVVGDDGKSEYPIALVTAY